jgi:hypothetical protein
MQAVFQERLEGPRWERLITHGLRHDQDILEQIKNRTNYVLKSSEIISIQLGGFECRL